MYYGYNNMLPAQQVIKVNGKQSIDTMQMAPNSSVLVMDTSAPVVWMCISDGVGRVTATPYDITPHKDTPAPDSVEARLAAVEAAIKRMEVKHESNDAAVDNESAIPAEGNDEQYISRR